MNHSRSVRFISSPTSAPSFDHQFHKVRVARNCNHQTVRSDFFSEPSNEGFTIEIIAVETTVNDDGVPLLLRKNLHRLSNTGSTGDDVEPVIEFKLLKPIFSVSFIIFN